MTTSDNRTAIVTGGSRGFGLELARSLVAKDWTVVIDARNRDELTAAAHDLSMEGTGEVIPIPGDVADPAHAVHLIETASGSGELRLLVNNASILGPSPQPSIAEYPLAVWSDVLAVNLLAPIQLVQQALPHLRRPGGTIVNITSDAAVEGYEGWGGYGSSKAALEQVSNVLAAEEADVTVYWFDPGDMNTRMHQEAFPGEDISDRPGPASRVPALMDLLESNSPSGRYTADAILDAMVKA